LKSASERKEHTHLEAEELVELPGPCDVDVSVEEGGGEFEEGEGNECGGVEGFPVAESKDMAFNFGREVREGSGDGCLLGCLLGWHRRKTRKGEVVRVGGSSNAKRGRGRNRRSRPLPSFLSPRRPRNFSLSFLPCIARDPCLASGLPSANLLLPQKLLRSSQQIIKHHLSPPSRPPTVLQVLRQTTSVPLPLQLLGSRLELWRIRRSLRPLRRRRRSMVSPQRRVLSKVSSTPKH